MKSEVAIVLLSYNARRFLKKALFSFLAQFDPQAWREISLSKEILKQAGKALSLRPVTLVVVDNNSRDNSLEIARQAQKYARGIKNARIKIITNRENLGFAAGNDVGISWALNAGFHHIGLLNNDTVIGNPFWDPLADFLEAHAAAGAVTTKIYFAPSYEYRKNYRNSEKGKVIWAVGGNMNWNNVVGTNRGVDEVDKGQYEMPVSVAAASGCLLLAKREVWERAGDLDKRYFMYYEDADWCQRIRRQGWEIFYVPGGMVWHFNAGSSKVGGALQDYFISRNRLLFGMRWAPWRAKAALLRESGRLLFKGRKWQKIGVRDFYLRKFGRGSWIEER